MDEVSVVVPPGADGSAFLTGPAGRTTLVNASGAAVDHAADEGVAVDAVLERTDRPDRDALARLAATRDGDLPVYVPGGPSLVGDRSPVDRDALPTGVDARVYAPRTELADDLFDERRVGDHEASVTALTARRSHGHLRRTALDVRLVDRSGEDRLERLRNEARTRRGRPVRADADQPRSVLLAAGTRHACRRTADEDLRRRLRDGTPRVGAVTHPDPDAASRSDLLDRVDHDVVVAGGPLHPDRRAAAAARGADLRRADDAAVTLGLTPAGLAVSRDAGTERTTARGVVDELPPSRGAGDSGRRADGEGYGGRD
jgi:hypothetical protein